MAHRDTLDLRFLDIRCGETLLDGDAIGTPKAAVEVIAVQGCQGVGTDERLGLGLELAAQHHGAHAAQSEMLSMEHGVGHIGDALKARKMLDEPKRRRT